MARSARTACHSMNVPEQSPRGTRVRLPPDVARPFEIYVNGVPQEEGRDFAIEGRTLVFERELKGEGKLGVLALALDVGRASRARIARTTRWTSSTSGTESASSPRSFRSSRLGVSCSKGRR